MSQYRFTMIIHLARAIPRDGSTYRTREGKAEHIASRYSLLSCFLILCGNILTRNLPSKAVSTVSNMFDIFLITSRGEFLSKFARRQEGRAQLTALRGTVFLSFSLTFAPGFIFWSNQRRCCLQALSDWLLRGTIFVPYLDDAVKS